MPRAVRVVVVGAVAICFSLIASGAVAAPGTVLVFAPTNPKAGRTVTVKAVPSIGSRCTPMPSCSVAFHGAVIPIPDFRGPAKVYLVPNSLAPHVRSVRDAALIPIGTLTNGSLVFKPSNLKNNTAYAAVVSCAACSGVAQGRTLFVIGVGDNYNGLTPLMLLRPHGFPNGGGISPWVIGLVAAALALLALLLTRIGRSRRRPPTAATETGARATHQAT